MLENAMPLKRSLLASPLKAQSAIKPKGNSTRKTLIASLMLTSLVDAFSILVIFLILNHSSGQEAVDFDTKKLALPQISEAQLIMQGVVVRVEGQKYFVDRQEIGVSQLFDTLKNLQATVEDSKREGIVVVADKDMDYEGLSPIITAGSQAGFTKFKFAVIKKD